MNSIVISAPADGQGHEPEASPAGERPQDGRRPLLLLIYFYPIWKYTSGIFSFYNPAGHYQYLV